MGTHELRWEVQDGLPRMVLAPDGTPLIRGEHVDGSWRLHLRLPDHGSITLVLDASTHPVLGRCDLVLDREGKRLARGSAVDWRAPTEIPALDRPGALPRGAGTALLNLLAWQAVRAGSGPLRYHGPYPSEALWTTLRASFRVDGPPDEAEARFVAEGEARAVAGTRAPIDVAFHPEPHTWHWSAPRVCVQRRRGIERVYVDGRPFEREGPGPWCLDEQGSEWIAGVRIAGVRWAELLRLDPEGVPRGEPQALPRAPTDLVSSPLPPPVTAVLCEVLVLQAPRLLQPAMRRTMDALELRWGDTAPELVRACDDAIELHAGLVAALPTDPSALLGTLVHLVQPTARRLAAASLAAAWDEPSG
ncbi:MAG: hypothetical protein H6712_11760 [Myxococcales bacterium]|nr:hypothetical protein [Myxococcales bacterium]MCB9714530.1 hypothetical protein [Myxococcales bacterium]